MAASKGLPFVTTTVILTTLTCMIEAQLNISYLGYTTSQVFNVTNPFDVIWSNASAVSVGLSNSSSNNSQMFMFGYIPIANSTAIGNLVVRTFNQTSICLQQQNQEKNENLDIPHSDSLFSVEPPFPSQFGLISTSAYGFSAALSLGFYETQKIEQLWLTYASSDFGIIYTTALTTFASPYKWCGIGNIWFDEGSQVFFYSYWKNVTLYVSGIYAINGSSFYYSLPSNSVELSFPWSLPMIVLNFQTTLDLSVDNRKLYITWNSEPTVGYGAIYYTAIDYINGITVLNPTVLVQDSINLSFTPAGVWSLANSFVISLNLVNSTSINGTSSNVYSLIHIINGTNELNFTLQSPQILQHSLVHTILVQSETGEENDESTVMIIQTSISTSETFNITKYNITVSDLSSPAINIEEGEYLGVTNGPITLFEDAYQNQWLSWTDFWPLNSSKYPNLSYVAILNTNPAVICDQSNISSSGSVGSEINVESTPHLGNSGPKDSPNSTITNVNSTVSELPTNISNNSSSSTTSMSTQSIQQATQGNTPTNSDYNWQQNSYFVLVLVLASIFCCLFIVGLVMSRLAARKRAIKLFRVVVPITPTASLQTEQFAINGLIRL